MNVDLPDSPVPAKVVTTFNKLTTRRHEREKERGEKERQRGREKERGERERETDRHTHTQRMKERGGIFLSVCACVLFVVTVLVGK